jgi:hypothetical protein
MLNEPRDGREPIFRSKPVDASTTANAKEVAKREHVNCQTKVFQYIEGRARRLAAYVRLIVVLYVKNDVDRSAAAVLQTLPRSFALHVFPVFRVMKKIQKCVRKRLLSRYLLFFNWAIIRMNVLQ